jgi:hypothetical protein
MQSKADRLFTLADQVLGVHLNALKIADGSITLTVNVGNT